MAVHGKIAWRDKKSQKKQLDIANMYGKMGIKQCMITKRKMS